MSYLNRSSDAQNYLQDWFRRFRYQVKIQNWQQMSGCLKFKKKMRIFSFLIEFHTGWTCSHVSFWWSSNGTCISFTSAWAGFLDDWRWRFGVDDSRRGLLFLRGRGLRRHSDHGSWCGVTELDLRVFSRTRERLHLSAPSWRWHALSLPRDEVPGRISLNGFWNFFKGTQRFTVFGHSVHGPEMKKNEIQFENLKKLTPFAPHTSRTACRAAWRKFDSVEQNK